MLKIHWSRAVRPTKNLMNIPVGRMSSVHPRAGERYYLRVLLLYVRGATSYEDIRTVKGELCETFHAACLRRGLLADDKEWHRCLEESAFNDMPKRMRFLFATILSLSACRTFGTVGALQRRLMRGLLA